MTTEITTVDSTPAALLEKVLVGGDLSKLTAAERLEYYKRTCDSLHLNWLTRPFDYITLSGRLVLYARKDAAEQLRQNHGISIIELEREIVNDTYVVTATARTPEGRTDTDMGAVAIKGLQGDALVNAMLKAVTKAKRRVTLSICGLGMLDETETETIPGARPVQVDIATGEIVGQSTLASTPTPTAAELAKQALAKGAVTLDWLRQWCDARGVTKIEQAPERDRVQLAHELANNLAIQG